MARFFRIALGGVFTNKMSINSRNRIARWHDFALRLRETAGTGWQDGKIFQNSPCWCFHHQEWYEKNYVIAEPLLVFSPTR
jgi:hypothetical protein